jgi:hypothetical protein
VYDTFCVTEECDCLSLHHGELENEGSDRFNGASSFTETQQDFEAELTTGNPFSKHNLSMGRTVA